MEDHRRIRDFSLRHRVNERKGYSGTNAFTFQFFKSFAIYIEQYDAYLLAIVSPCRVENEKEKKNESGAEHRVSVRSFHRFIVHIPFVFHSRSVYDAH